MKNEQTQERTKFWRDPVLGQLELLHAAYVTHTFTRHFHEGFALGVITSGTEQFEYGREQYVATAGNVVVVNPGVVHTGEAGIEAGWTYRMIYPAISHLQHAANQLAGHQRPLPFFPNPVIHDPALAHALRQFHHDLDLSRLSTLERESRWLWLLTQLISRHAAGHSAQPSPPVGQEATAVQRVRDYLNAHHSQHIGLTELASLANLSQFHLIRVFRHQTGLPPHSYLTQLRIAQARRLLSLGLPIAQVATDTGFTDQSHLARHFKRVVGIPPGQFLLKNAPYH